MAWQCFSLILPFFFLANSVVSLRPEARPSVLRIAVPESAISSNADAATPSPDTTYYFDQLIDHNDPSLGTFQQRYWHSWEFYQPGGPIVLTTPGESNADGLWPYLTNQTIIGQIAQQENGAAVLLEHRFFGLSNPYANLTDASLSVLTVQQSIDDLEYFANNVKLPMPGGDNVKPDTAPWILVGASYAGALTAWTMQNKPGLFAAGYASSAVVETIADFWQFFEPIREFMPANCSADVQAVIAHFDETFTGTDTTAINDLKASFGMGDLTHLDDVVTALKNPLDYWQSLSPAADSDLSFFAFCDALEVKDGVNAPASGWGLDNAVAAWGNYFSKQFIPSYCGTQNIVDCFGSYDGTLPYYTNTAVNNAVRSWQWLACNELGFFQDSAPVGQPTLVSRLVTPAYRERQCSLMFPTRFPKPPQIIANVDVTQRKHGGWDLSLNHIFFANGQRDPWREATMSAQSSGNKALSGSQQVIAVSDGFHCSDIATYYGDVDSSIKAVQVQALQSMSTWLQEWRAEQASASAGNNAHKRSSKWGRDRS